MKNLTSTLSSSLIAKNINNPEGVQFQSKLVSILVSKSDQLNIQKDTANSIAKQLAVVDFSECEQYLKDNGLINKNEVLLYSKTDFSGSLKVSPNSTNTTSAMDSSVSYDIYASNGTLINKSLCSGVNTNINLFLNSLDISNLTYKNDPNSTYFNSICTPMKINDTSYVLNDKRANEFDNKNSTCSVGCIL